MPLPPFNAPKSKLVNILAECTSQADGSIIYRPIRIGDASLRIDLQEAHRICGFSQRHLQRLCDEGELKSAVKRGKKRKSHWLVDRAEIVGLIQPPAE